MKVNLKVNSSVAARIIKRNVSYFNGWRVSDTSVDEACQKAAMQIFHWLNRRLKAAEKTGKLPTEGR